jgi:hypothetical protein
MPGRQGGDDVELLGVEQDQEPGDPAGGRVGIVVEESACVCPPAVLVKRAGWAGPARGGGGETGGVTAGDRPADEVRRPGRVAAGPGQPLVELGLGAGGQGQPACGEPVQERRSGGYVVAHVLDLLAGGGPAVEAAAQPAQVMPDGISAQGLPVPGIRLPGDGLAEPAFQGCEALVPGRERARGRSRRYTPAHRRLNVIKVCAR